MSGHQPLERFAEGDPSEEAFEAAVPELARLIRGYLSWFGAGPDVLEDLAQEAIVKVYVYRNRRRGSGVPSLKGWLRVLCRNLVVDGGRDGRLPTVVARVDLPAAVPPDREVGEILELCIEGLREPDRTVFRLRYDAGWPTAEIAELFGWKPRNCELILARAREALGRCLARAGCAVPGVAREQGRRGVPQGGRRTRGRRP